MRLNTTETGSHLLVEYLGPFHRRHPQIEIELNTNDAMIDMTRGEAELAIRYRSPGTGPGVDATGHVDVVAKRATPLGVAVYASREYLEAAGPLRGVHDVEGHHAILPRQDAMYLPGSNWARAVEDRVGVALRSDSPSAMAIGCSAGLGLAALVCASALKLDNLVRLSDVIDTRDTWLLMPGDLRRVARVRALWDFLVSLHEEWGPLWSGEVTPADRDRRIGRGAGR